MAESLHISSGMGGLPRLLNNDHTLTFDLFTARSSLLPYAFVWEKTFKNLILQNRECLVTESLHISSGTPVYQSC